MKRIIVSGTDFTPALDLDPVNLTMKFQGVSRPENVEIFYQQVIDWVEQLSEESDKLTKSTIQVTFKLDYCNSASQKYILIVLEELINLKEKNINLQIEWYYDSEDEKMLEDGEDIADALGIDFVFHTFE